MDAPRVDIQYEVLSLPGQEPALVKKISFPRLLDFVHAGDAEGVCAQAVRQLWAVIYSGRGRPLPTAAASPQGRRNAPAGRSGPFPASVEKVKNSEIWQLHQRAYKKCFARTHKGTMSRAGFALYSN